MFISSSARIFSGDIWVSLIREYLLWSGAEALAEDLLYFAIVPQRSRKASVAVAAVASAVAVDSAPISTPVGDVTAAGSDAADVADASCAAAASVAAADEVAVMILSSADTPSIGGAAAEAAIVLACAVAANVALLA